MKVWRYQEMLNKVVLDLDLGDELFIKPPEFVGYFNEAIEEAESELNTLTTPHSYDYFLTTKPVPVVINQDTIPLPVDIYADKIRRVMYQNGSIIYPVSMFKSRFEFEDIAFSAFYGKPDDYRFVLVNDQPGQMRMKFVPVLRETAILPPPLPYPESFDASAVFTPVVIWYMRSAFSVCQFLRSIMSKENFFPVKVCSLPPLIPLLIRFQLYVVLFALDGFTQSVAGGVPLHYWGHFVS